jgi:hypothetical protein
MPQSCKICIHTDRQAIDAAILANRDSLRSLAAQYGVSKDSLSRHFHTHLEPRQAAEPRIATSKPSTRVDRYRAFIERFSGGRTFSMTEVRGWGYSPEELDVLVRLAIERGNLSRRSEPRQ